VPGQPEHLHIEGDAVDRHQVKEEPCHRGAKCLEAALCVLEPDIGHGVGQLVEHPALDHSPDVGRLDC
jgi:hypothetical protein